MIVEASPDTTIGEFKRNLMDELTDLGSQFPFNADKFTSVQVMMGESKLTDNGETVMQAGLSSDVVLQACLTGMMTCSSCICMLLFLLLLMHHVNVICCIALGHHPDSRRA